MHFSRALAVAFALAACWPLSAQAQPDGTRGRAAACQELLTLRNEVGKHGQAIQAAAKKKVGAEQLCKLFGAFLAAESNMLKTLEERKATCGVSNEVIKQVKEGHGKASNVAKQVCEVAQGQPAGLMPSGQNPAACDGLWARLSCGMGGEP
jgi:hypothetical protein